MQEEKDKEGKEGEARKRKEREETQKEESGEEKENNGYFDHRHHSPEFDLGLPLINLDAY